MRKIILLLMAVAVTVILVAQERQTKLAVMEIEDKSGKLSKGLLENAAEALRSEIGATNKFVLISKDRQRQAMIKGEKKESWKECYDQACRIQLGQELTADSILTGIVTLFGGTYTLTVELIDLAKAATVKTAKADFDGTEKGLAEAIKSIATQIAGVKRGGAFQTGKVGGQVEEWEVGQGEETIVKFDSTPGEAVVLVDGRILCQKTPCSKMLTQGKHEVTIQKENYLPKIKVFDIKKGQNISAQLEPDFGWLNVAANHPEIVVFLDGTNIGAVPVKKKEIAPGPHEVALLHRCFHPVGEKFVLARGETKNIQFDLQEKDSAIKVTAQDKDGNDVEADIFVDGENIGTAPGTYKVALCSKELVIKSKAGQYKQELDLEEKKVAKVSAVLKKSGVGTYDIDGDVVIDKKSGIMWQRARNDDKMNHSNAIEYCKDLSLDGYSDWRLPTISELKTLIVGCHGTDACKVSDNCLSQSCYSDSCYCKANQGPGEDGCYWQKDVWQGGGDDFWSSSVPSGRPGHAWLVLFGYGTFGVNSRNDDFYVRCVRGVQAKNNQPLDLEKMAVKGAVHDKSKGYNIQDKVVVDKGTGLMWQRANGGQKDNHADAIEYCKDLSLSGYSDWRLPTISELKTLIVGCQSGTDACNVKDDCLSDKCHSDSCYCKNKQGPGEKGYYWQKETWQGGGEWFWSSSSSDYSDIVWDVKFSNGGLGYNFRSHSGYSVRCVRSPLK